MFNKSVNPRLYIPNQILVTSKTIFAKWSYCIRFAINIIPFVTVTLQENKQETTRRSKSLAQTAVQMRIHMFFISC